MSAARGNAISTRLRTVTVAERFGYAVRWAPVGPEDIKVGSPTQMITLGLEGDD